MGIIRPMIIRYNILIISLSFAKFSFIIFFIPLFKAIYLVKSHKLLLCACVFVVLFLFTIFRFESVVIAQHNLLDNDIKEIAKYILIDLF